jgi:hypothetical protein
MTAMISYRSSDRQVADELSGHLRASGISPWIDHQHIAQGAQWRDELMTQLRECEAFFPLISKLYMASEHCRMELLIARSFDRQIIPIMLDDCWNDLPSTEATKGLDDLFILNLHGLNTVGLPAGRDEIFRRAAAGVRRKSIERSGHVYFTYLERDAVLATNLARELSQKGIPTWIASLDTIAGENWRKAQVRSMHRASCQFILLSDGITQNQFVQTEVLMAEAIGLPVFMAFHPEIRSDNNRIVTINAELRQSDLAFRRVFDRNAFIVQSESPLASDEMVKSLKSVARPRSKWLSLKW